LLTGGGNKVARSYTYGYVIGFTPRVAAPLTKAFELNRGSRREEQGEQEGDTAKRARVSE